MLQKDLGVNRSNGGLQRIGAETARCKSALGERNAFDDLVVILQRAIMLV
jgi:hypothetical protein